MKLTTGIFITLVSLSLLPTTMLSINNPPISNTIQRTNMRIISSLATPLWIHSKNLTARRNFFISFTSAFLIFNRLFCLTPFYAHKHTFIHLLGAEHMPWWQVCIHWGPMHLAILGPATLSLNYTHSASSLLVKKVKLIYILPIIWCLNDAFYP